MELADSDVKEGTILTLKFKVSDEAEVNHQYSISISSNSGDIIDRNLKPVSVLFQKGNVTVIGHEWDEGVITTDPTCTEVGIKTFTCENCHATKTEAIEALGHKPVTDEAVAATCDETGLTEGSHCERCGEILVAQEVIPTTGHKWDDGEVIKASTCKTEGTSLHSCNDCDAVWVEKLDKLEHHEVIDAAVPATCTETGLTEGSPFTDVKLKADGTKPYYYDDVVWAKITGVITGYPEGSFGPKKNITRADIAVTMVRYAADQGISTENKADITGMPDYGRVPKYAREALSWAYANGIITGKDISGSKYLASRDNATRQECATILQRFYQVFNLD